MSKTFVNLALAACIAAAAYGLFKVFRTTIAFGMPPDFPFPFLPNEITWFDHTIQLEYFCDPISCVYRNPAWLVWSLALYLGVFGILALSLKSRALLIDK